MKSLYRPVLPIVVGLVLGASYTLAAAYEAQRAVWVCRTMESAYKYVNGENPSDCVQDYQKVMSCKIANGVVLPVVKDTRYRNVKQYQVMVCYLPFKKSGMGFTIDVKSGK